MHPNSIANLRPPWKPGEKPNPLGLRGISKVEKALEISQNACPKAARLIARTVSNEDAPLSLRVRCAEFLLDKALPPQQGAGLTISGPGVEWLELRFVAPGGAQSEPQRIALPEPEAVDVEPEDETTP